jgi:hypothetical protein
MAARLNFYNKIMYTLHADFIFNYTLRGTNVESLFICLISFDLFIPYFISFLFYTIDPDVNQSYSYHGSNDYTGYVPTR